jgi:hypothetical protein
MSVTLQNERAHEERFGRQVRVPSAVADLKSTYRMKVYQQDGRISTRGGRTTFHFLDVWTSKDGEKVLQFFEARFPGVREQAMMTLLGGTLAISVPTNFL